MTDRASERIGGDVALPIDAALPEFLARLDEGRNVVLQAPPGAGKTTRAPLAVLHEARWRGDGAIVMLQPRRVAARAAAERLAETLGERVGGRVGYTIRHERRVSAATRIEVVTEGILTRRLQSDPSLDGVAAVLFDEIHERSLHADLGLALCLEAQAALRPDLRLVAMSATLDGAALAALMDAAVVTSEGRAYPVETRWRDAPLGKDDRAPERFHGVVAEALVAAMRAGEGDALAFLPGAREIDAVARRAAGAFGGEIDVRPLHGGLPFEAQRRALAPPLDGRRKAVIATNIAETSLTIPGVRIVVDAGRSRRARFDPAVGMNRLTTTLASRAAAEQRRGRAGRTAPGLCMRLWSRGEEGAMPAYDPPEILESDLAGLALELAAWGASPETLPFLDPPPEAAYAQAVALLRALGAIDRRGGITEHGRLLASAPTHPRLAHMLALSGGDIETARLAALLEDRDPLRGSDHGVDVAARLKALSRPAAHPAARGALERLSTAADSLRKRAPKALRPRRDLSIGQKIALAFPDRVARRRAGQSDDPDARKPIRALLAQGRGAEIAPADPLARAEWLAIAALDFPESAARSGRDPRVALAAALSRPEIEAVFADRIEVAREVMWSKREETVKAVEERRLGAIALESRVWADAPPDAVSAAMLEGVRQLGLDALPWTDACRRLQARVVSARESGAEGSTTLPDLSDAGLLASLETWLAPFVAGMTRRADLTRLDLRAALSAQLDFAATQTLTRLRPSAWIAPNGSEIPVDYADAPPKVRARLQALFGLVEHPRVGGAPLLIEILSPADRPIQLTADLPGFWRGSYADVRKEMRARYPKHAWPEDPAAEAPRARDGGPRRGGAGSDAKR